jgi:pilus assembly protein CpaB
MKAARIIVLGVALAAGGAAAFLVAGSEKQALPEPKVVQFETTDVLIAAADVAMGRAIAPQEMQWQAWPTAAAGAHFIRKSDRPDAVEQLAGSITRAPFSQGEPIRENKLIKAKGSGYMAAILPAGMRAISTEISPETGAGGFILPNDRVDVILSRRDKEQEKATGVDSHTSETVLSNIRILAIDQTVEEKNGQRVVVGKTATLELTQPQAERLALARQQGTISLALRSLVDSASPTAEISEDRPGSRRGINTVRFGVTSTTVSK